MNRIITVTILESAWYFFSNRCHLSSLVPRKKDLYYPLLQLSSSVVLSSWTAAVNTFVFSFKLYFCFFIWEFLNSLYCSFDLSSAIPHPYNYIIIRQFIIIVCLCLMWLRDLVCNVWFYLFRQSHEMNGGTPCTGVVICQAAFYWEGSPLCERVEWVSLCPWRSVCMLCMGVWCRTWGELGQNVSFNSTTPWMFNDETKNLFLFIFWTVEQWRCYFTSVQPPTSHAVGLTSWLPWGINDH